MRRLAGRYPIETTRIVLAKHAAGGHLARWLASRHSLGCSNPLFGGNPLRVCGVVAIAGIADLQEFYKLERFTCDNPPQSRCWAARRRPYVTPTPPFNP